MPAERDDFPVARVAALARLRLSPSEDALFQGQLQQIIALVGRVAAAAVDGPAPDGAQGPGEGAGRPDEVAPSLPAAAALANAPDAPGGQPFIRVPKVIG
jgi:aspartyl-tRNA(Asn)/glutamyl-tRNA(Gln) amidotransferase subunit C